MKKTWLIAISLVLLIIFLGIVLFFPLSETSKSSSITGSQLYDNTSYAEILRFLDRSMTYPGVPYPKPIAILPGELPSDLPVKIPIPNDAEVIGSIVSSDDKYKQVRIILDVPGEPDEIIEFYRNSLKKAGWNEQESFYDSYGFSSIPSFPKSATFCQNEREGPSLWISVYTLDGEKTADVQLVLNANPQAPVCSERYDPRESTKDVLPLLLAPEGAEQRGGGGSSGGNIRSLYTVLETELSVIELETHYRDQLIETGWELKEEGSSGSITWSTWSFSDEFGIWSGHLLVSDLTKKNLKYIQLIIS